MYQFNIYASNRELLACHINALINQLFKYY